MNIFNLEGQVGQDKHKIVSAKTCNELKTLLGSCVSMIGFRHGHDISSNLGFMTHFQTQESVVNIINKLSITLKKDYMGFKSFGNIVLVGGHCINGGYVGGQLLERTKMLIAEYNNNNAGGDKITYTEYITGDEHSGTIRRLDLEKGDIYRKYIGVGTRNEFKKIAYRDVVSEIFR